MQTSDVKMCDHEALKTPQTQSWIVCVCSWYTDVATHMLLDLIKQNIFSTNSKKIDILWNSVITMNVLIKNYESKGDGWGTHQHISVAECTVRSWATQHTQCCLPQRKTSALAPPEGRDGAQCTGLKADIKRDARQKRKSPDTQPWGTSNPDSSLSHEVVTREKHAGDLQETNKTQSSPAIRFALLLLKLTESPFFFFLPCSKNSDLRFKFFKDMDSDSTWEKEIRTQWVMREQGNMLSSNNDTWDKRSASKMYNHVFLTSCCYITQQMPLILSATVQWAQRWFKSTQRQSPGCCASVCWAQEWASRSIP